ncbi:hypothetical protein C8R45DRAFT_841956 [Mycena sanguinolenta]|nr:hypothetical protein C8R45DRAFT_841956 [Mycena sanguinolenta]
MNISLVSVSLATVALESCLYGVYLVLALTSICLLLGRNTSLTRRSTPIFRSPIFVGAIGLFLTITAHWVITIDRGFLAFVHIWPLGPLGFYADISELTEVVKTGFLIATAIIGDGLIIHRLWVVWSYNKKVIIFPIATLSGLAVSGAGLTYQFSQYRPGQTVFLSEAGRWINTATVFTLWCEIQFVPSLKVRVHHHFLFYVADLTKSVLVIIVESAALYTTWSGFYLVSYQAQSNLQFILSDCLPAITGISCMLIHVRVGVGWARTGGQHPSTPPGTQLSALTVSITRVRHTDLESFDCPTDEVNEEQNKRMV